MAASAAKPCRGGLSTLKQGHLRCSFAGSSHVATGLKQGFTSVTRTTRVRGILTFSARTRKGRCNSTSSLSSASEYRSAAAEEDSTAYLFSDEGSTVQLRIPVPPSLSPLSKDQVKIQSTPDSLAVTVAAADGTVQSLLSVRPLFSAIAPKHTTWYLNDAAIVVLLRKDKAVAGQAGGTPWPGLGQDWGTLTGALVPALKSCSVYLGGNCSYRVKWDVAQELARGLGYTPLSTELLLEQLSGSTIEQLLASEGPESVAKAEAEILQNVCTNVRVVVASMSPFPLALDQALNAGSVDARWRSLFSGMLVWLDLTGNGKISAPPEQPVDAAIRIGVTEKEWESSCHARAAAEGVVKALRAVLAAEPQLPGKKSLYLRMGSRGDWPDMMPPGWDPQRSSDMNTSA